MTALSLDMRVELFPARAGVILAILRYCRDKIPVPRTRGGDPAKKYRKGMEYGCSPHMRG